jgi:hypothetical protein
MPSVFHHLHREVDRVSHIAHGTDAAGPKLGTLHHPGVKLDVTFEVQTSSDSRIEKWFVFKLADSGHRRDQCTATDLRPAGRQRSVDRSLALRALGHGHRAGAAVDDQSLA